MRLLSKTAFAVVIGLNLGHFGATEASAANDVPVYADKAKLQAFELENTPDPSFFVAPKKAVEFSTDWVDAQPEPASGPQLDCLAQALYFEARGETVKGQFAVAEVILNRVDSERFPDTACNVINQGTGAKYQCQFTYTCDGRAEVIKEPRAYERVAKVARAALDGQAPEITEGATHYHTKAVNPRWSRVYTKTAAIGTHIFYRHTWQTVSN
ncbi:MAG: cell wall hydrolase [Pseudomonadota bacterium]